MQQQSRLQKIHGEDHEPVPKFTRDTVRSVKASWEFFLAWIRITWFDILVNSAIGGASLGVS